MANQTVTVERPKSRYRATSGTSVLESVSPADLHTARRQAASGKPAKLYAILDFFLSLDDVIPGALLSLRSAIMESAQFEPMEKSPEAELQVRVLEAAAEELDLVGLIDSLLLGHFYGMRACETGLGIVKVDGRPYQVPVTFEELPQDWIYADKESRADDHTTLFVGDAPYHTYADGTVLLYTARKLPSYRSIDFTAFGCGLAASRFGIFAWFDVEDWAAFNEAFGTPTVVGTLLQGFGKDDKELLTQAVMGAASDSRAVISDKAKLELLQAQADGSSAYDRLMDVTARARARIVKSESLTDHQAGKGSNAAMMTTNGIRLDVAAYLARRVARLLNRKLFGPALDLSFKRRLARFALPVKAADDLLVDVRVAREAQAMGLPVSAAQLRERTGLRAPEDEADTLRPASAGFSAFAGI